MPKDCAPQPYPGSTSGAEEILALAQAYRASALALIGTSRRDPIAAAPAHFCALHSIELALNAWRRHVGEPPEAIRAHRHALSCPRIAGDLGLRRRTVEHLLALTDRREYLLARYAPGASHVDLPQNRLTATLNEVVSKVERRIDTNSRLPCCT